ncbi:MAG: DNA repair protein [Clostridia bacterium]|nr:DNA repair protein [Clostridia bacterium]MBP3596566.1 DNA repair protein [Clostridia bacterium]
MDRVYLCIDFKTFFASVECAERGLDPFCTNLVVADTSRGKGTICLAITPQMKMLGIKNRCRLFEVPENVKYIAAMPRMQKYIEYAANIYAIYLKYFAKEDIHVYSIDESFIEITHYLKMYKMKSMQLAQLIMKEVYDTYGISSACGIGTNLYLAKIALDIMAKHSTNNIGWLTEERYKKELWHHRPLSDFWQIGNGIERRLKKHGILDMYDIAHTNPKILYKEFGVNAEFLIDHALGIEPCTIADIKAYKPKSNSICNSQILFEDYSFDKAEIVLKEMIEIKSLELVENDLVTERIKLYIGYSKDIVESTGGSVTLPKSTNVFSDLEEAFLRLYRKTTNRNVAIRRIGVYFEKVTKIDYEQLDLFVDQAKIEKERKIEKTISQVKNKHGKNAILRGMNLIDGATAKVRNTLIGGHNGQ